MCPPRRRCKPGPVRMMAILGDLPARFFHPRCTQPVVSQDAPPSPGGRGRTAAETEPGLTSAAISIAHRPGGARGPYAVTATRITDSGTGVPAGSKHRTSPASQTATQPLPRESTLIPSNDDALTVNMDVLRVLLLREADLFSAPFPTFPRTGHGSPSKRSLSGQLWRGPGAF